MPERTSRKVREWADLDTFRVRTSPEHLVLEDHWIPTVIELETTGQEPQVYFKIQVEPSGPRLIEFTFRALDPDSAGIRQTDFREVEVAALLREFVAIWTVRVERDADGRPDSVTIAPDDAQAISNFVGKLGKRTITPQFLERVAEVYRENIQGAPTKAVEHHFQVRQRMAAEYVSKARKAGLLPPTKRGKKNA